MGDNLEKSSVTIRICPVCRADIDIFSSVCDYCDAEIALPEETEAILRNAQAVLKESDELLNSPEIKSSKAEKTVEKIKTVLEILSTFEESAAVRPICSGLKKNQMFLEEKIPPLKKKERKKLIALTVLLSLISEFVLLFVFMLAAFLGRENIETVVLGGLGLFGLIIGAMFMNDSPVAGAIGGLILGEIIGGLIVWLISYSIGQFVLFIGWTIFIIIFDAIRLRKK